MRETINIMLSLLRTPKSTLIVTIPIDIEIETVHRNALLLLNNKKTNTGGPGGPG
jgi:hypothetical protein